MLRAWRLLACVSVLVFVACRRSDDGASRAATASKSSLTIGVGGEPDTLFGPFVTSIVGNEILSAGAAPLVSLERDGKWAPYAAERLPRFEDGSMRWLDEAKRKLVVTWKIREDFHWPDGKPLVADDYAFGVTICLDAKLPVVIRSPCEGIESAVAAPNDPRTLVVTWSKPTVHATTGYLTPLPRHVLEAPYRESPERFAEISFAQKPMLAGPFTVEEWSPGSHVTLVRNPHAGPSLRPKLERITLRFVPHPSTMVANLQARSLDMAVGLGLDVAVTAELPPHAVLDLVDSDKQLRLDFNLDRAPLNDVRVRRALMHAIDRNTFNERVFGGRAELSEAPVRRTSPFYDDTQAPIAFDLTKAAALLDEAGFPRGADGKRAGLPTLVLHTIADRPAYEQLALVIQGAWRSIGVDVDIRAAPMKLLFDVYQKRTFDVVLASAEYDPTYIEPSWWTCAGIPTKENGLSGLNSMGWCNSEVDATLAALAVEHDDAKRAALGKKFHALFARDLPLVPLYFVPSAAVRPKSLAGFTPSSWPGFASHAERWTF